MIALDHRGHGRGIRSRRRFRLADCADDALALCDVLGAQRVIPVGYSMGGPIAQLCWQRHRDRVRGLVLCATGAHFSRSREERLGFLGLSGLAVLARLTPTQLHDRLSDQLYLQRKTTEWGEWAVSEAARHHWRTVLEAGHAIGNFDSTGWLGEVDVPTAIVTTLRDRVIPLRRQEQLFELIPTAEAFRVDGDHASVAHTDGRFLPALLRAIHSTVERSETDSNLERSEPDSNLERSEPGTGEERR